MKHGQPLEPSQFFEPKKPWVGGKLMGEHELRADVTTIVAKNNNPLKFSPNADVALQHLLAPPARGFIAAAPAMRDAYEDLRTHQFGIVAGMQAVLEAALQRFDPAARYKYPAIGPDELDAVGNSFVGHRHRH